MASVMRAMSSFSKAPPSSSTSDDGLSLSLSNTLSRTLSRQNPKLAPQKEENLSVGAAILAASPQQFTSSILLGPRNDTVDSSKSSSGPNKDEAPRSVGSNVSNSPSRTDKKAPLAAYQTMAGTVSVSPTKTRPGLTSREHSFEKKPLSIRFAPLPEIRPLQQVDLDQEDALERKDSIHSNYDLDEDYQDSGSMFGSAKIMKFMSRRKKTPSVSSFGSYKSHDLSPGMPRVDSIDSQSSAGRSSLGGPLYHTRSIDDDTPSRRSNYPPVAQRSRSRKAPQFDSTAVKQPEFLEWGMSSSAGSKKSNGGEDDDGSGMAWLKKRRAEREARALEVTEDETKAEPTTTTVITNTTTTTTTTTPPGSPKLSPAKPPPATAQVQSGLSATRPIDIPKIAVHDTAAKSPVSDEFDLEEDDDDDDDDEDNDEDDFSDVDEEELAREEAETRRARKTAASAAAERYHTATHQTKMLNVDTNQHASETIPHTK